MRKVIFLMVLAMLAMAACKTKKEATKTETPVVKPTETAAAKPALDCSNSGLTFAAVQSIFDKHCISCHGYGGDAGYNFLSVADIRRAAQKGELLGTIKWHRGFPKMPAQADQLDQTSINQIECWVNNGMKE